MDPNHWVLYVVWYVLIYDNGEYCHKKGRPGNLVNSKQLCSDPPARGEVTDGSGQTRITVNRSDPKPLAGSGYGSEMHLKYCKTNLKN
jgi:hypothetical protein